MGFIQQNFTVSLTVPITLAGLADQAFASSSLIDNNAGNDYVSANIQVSVTTGAGGNANGSLICYMVRSVDDLTLDNIDNNLQILGVFNANGAVSTDYVFSMDTATTGTLPIGWGFAIFNNTGSALPAIQSVGTVVYCGKQYYAF